MLELIKNFLMTHQEWAYAILFGIVFVETGLIVMPFLPGDSLLFVAGVFAREGKFHLPTVYLLLITAALLGDNVNYWVGRYLGPKVFRSENSRLFNRKHLDKTQAFYAKYGSKAVVMARFVPIVRTFAPFVAGIGKMTYPRFLSFSVLGAVLWVGICVTAGYKFAGNEFVQKRFELVVVAIVLISVLPMVIELLLHRKRSKTAGY